MYIPGVLAMVSLFMVNTVDAKHLSNEYAEMAEGASPTALRIWLMAGTNTKHTHTHTHIHTYSHTHTHTHTHTGLMLGLGSIIQAIFIYVNLFNRYADIHSAPVSPPPCDAYTYTSIP